MTTVSEPLRVCANQRCRQAIPDTARADSRFCSPRCRLQDHRDRKWREQMEAQRIATEQHLARLAHEHKTRFVVAATKVAPRLTHTKAEELYHALIKQGILPPAFEQTTIKF